MLLFPVARTGLREQIRVPAAADYSRNLGEQLHRTPPSDLGAGQASLHPLARINRCLRMFLAVNLEPVRPQLFKRIFGKNAARIVPGA